ncbi:MAG TPA: hypothetical protein VK969_00895 [Acidimicrobiia bacterium]|nr:hypothetical protein [Acidimicrobiia bacterium]
MISWRMAAAWVAAVVAATVLTWQIVGLADSQVGESPVAVAPVLPTTLPEGSTSSAPTTSLDPTPSSTGPTSTTSTVATNSTSPSTAPTPEWSVRTVNSPGGTVVIRHRPGVVELQGATPAPGFGVEIDDDGPDRVRVEFESGDDDFRVEARWRDGTLVVEIDD